MGCSNNRKDDDKNKDKGLTIKDDKNKITHPQKNLK